MLTVKFKELDVPPPGKGLVTVTGNVPAVWMAEAGIEAVTCAEPTKVVVSAVPLNFTTDVGTKPEPLTVRVNAAPPVVAFEGESEPSKGDGLFTVKFREPEVPPPGDGLVTVTGNIPPVVRSEVGTAATSAVELPSYVVESALPLKFTTELLTKFVPVTDRLKPALPALILAVPREVSVGAGLFTCSAKALDVLPAKFESPEYRAVIDCVPAASADVVSVATALAFKVPRPSSKPLSRNATVPVGVPLVVLVTVAVNFTDAPTRMGVWLVASALVEEANSTFQFASRLATLTEPQPVTSS